MGSGIGVHLGLVKVQDHPIYWLCVPILGAIIALFVGRKRLVSLLGRQQKPLQGGSVLVFSAFLGAIATQGLATHPTWPLHAVVVLVVLAIGAAVLFGLARLGAYAKETPEEKAEKQHEEVMDELHAIRGDLTTIIAGSGAGIGSYPPGGYGASVSAQPTEGRRGDEH
jgi:hypothetical protein